MSSSSAIPVLMITGLPVFATYSMSGMSVISGDAILWAGTLSFSRKSTALKSKGEEKNIRPRSVANFCRSACHSHGVAALE